MLSVFATTVKLKPIRSFFFLRVSFLPGEIKSTGLLYFRFSDISGSSVPTRPRYGYRYTKTNTMCFLSSFSCLSGERTGIGSIVCFRLSGKPDPSHPHDQARSALFVRAHGCHTAASCCYVVTLCGAHSSNIHNSYVRTVTQQCV